MAASESSAWEMLQVVKRLLELRARLEDLESRAACLFKSGEAVGNNT